MKNTTLRTWRKFEIKENACYYEVIIICCKTHVYENRNSLTNKIYREWPDIAPNQHLRPCLCCEVKHDFDVELSLGLSSVQFLF